MMFQALFALLLQAMTINGQNVTPPLAEHLNIPSCMVCFQYRIHGNESDREARKRMFEAWIHRDTLLEHKSDKYFVKLHYHDSKGNCDTPDKSIKYKRKEDFPLSDTPIPGCRNVWFVKWERVP